MININMEGIEYNIFVISDTHFNHRNVITYSGRPYSDVEEMNKDLISRWNSVVSKNDIVIHCGDFALDKNSTIQNLRNQLNGRIILVRGNHDEHGIIWYQTRGFLYAKRARLKLVLPDGAVDVFSHYPPQKEVVNPNYFYYFGHVHNMIDEVETLQNVKCVSVERIMYTPYKVYHGYGGSIIEKDIDELNIKDELLVS